VLFEVSTLAKKISGNIVGMIQFWGLGYRMKVSPCFIRH